MITYILRRLLYTIPIVIEVLLLTFFCLQLSGAIFPSRLPENADALIAEIRHEYGFDKPLFWSSTASFWTISKS